MQLVKLSVPQARLYTLIDELLWQEWDPFGVNDIPESRDEYQLYTSQVVRLATHGATYEEIAQKLLTIEQETMGLFGNPEKNRNVAMKALQTASQCLIGQQSFTLTKEIVLDTYKQLLKGSLSLDAADRWAYELIQLADQGSISYQPSEDEQIIWKLILYLYGINLPNPNDLAKPMNTRSDIIDFLKQQGIHDLS